MENSLFKSLDYVFHPKSIAMIGASASFGKWGQMIFSNIVAGSFPGKVYPVNPRETAIFGIPAYKRVQEIPEPVDLAIITTPADTVLSVLEDCGQRGVRAAVVVTSGTTGAPKGVELTTAGLRAIGAGWAAAIGHEAEIGRASCRERV